jgi:phosphopantothenoylcysteine decarboxylase/phosphopantothenate--cysteine ligase
VRIALGVTGGIAAYKACEIVRALDRAGATVQVIMTRNATRFVAPLTFAALSRCRVLIETFDLDADETIQHIDLTRSIDALVIAPATANALAKLARGVADDFLSTFYTAVTAPVVLAPAMNTRMWLHPATQENVAALRGRGDLVVEPESGPLAERESGWGRLADPEKIVRVALDAARRSRSLEGRTIVVTAGPTQEAVDPVRFISNRSSGKMGYALAAAARRRGARVVLVSGPVALPPPYGVEVVPVTTSVEMREALERVCRGARALFMAAAVSDYVPRAAPAKIKKTGQDLVLTLEEGPDLLEEIARDRGDTVLVGFAAESEDLLENARRKLERKGVDFVVANGVSAIGAERSHVTILDRKGGALDVPAASKAEVAEAILDRVLGP